MDDLETLWAILAEAAAMRVRPAQPTGKKTVRRLVARLDAEIDGRPVAISMRGTATFRGRKIVDLRLTMGTA